MTMTLVSNRYRVVRELGKGGFGTTSLVEDTQLPSGRRCVLKELLPVESSAEIYTLVKQRFEREAVILEELGNLTLQIPSLYAYFAENNKFYLVQEYVEGETIAQKVQSQGVMSDAAVREWVMGLLPVLAVVHDRKIIHRDIKPENVILRQRDHKPVLIDFGAVRETMGTLINPNGQSTQSIVIGTPGFMASEQAAGRAVFASDLYSLGLTAIYALTGKMPQGLQTDPMTGNVQWRQYAPSVSAGLAAVIDRAIAPVSRDRFQTSGQMLDELLRSDSPIRIPETTISISPDSMSPGFGQTPMMTALPNNGNSGNYQPTIISAHANPYPAQQPMYQQPVPSNNDPKTWIMALGVGAMVILAGVGVMALVKDKDKTQVAQEPTSTQTSTSSAPPVTINNRTETQKEPVAAPNQPTAESVNPSLKATSLIENTPLQKIQSIGWIRVGAINHELASLRDGLPLIATSQPVTINPPVVPKLGDKIITVTGVNIRKNPPASPDYDPDKQEKLSVLNQPTKLVIIDKKTFVDPRRPSNTIVWAEVSLNDD